MCAVRCGRSSEFLAFYYRAVPPLKADELCDHLSPHIRGGTRSVGIKLYSAILSGNGEFGSCAKETAVVQRVLCGGA